VSLLRPSDLLNLEITGVNLRLDVADPNHPSLVVDDIQQAALLVVRFPPQTIFEEAFFDASPAVPGQVLDPSDRPPRPDPTAPRTPANPGDGIQFRLGAESRLVFRVPDIAVPYSIEGLLDWSKLELVVSPIADVPFGANPPAGVSDHSTARADRDNLAATVPVASLPHSRRRVAARYEHRRARGSGRALAHPTGHE